MAGKKKESPGIFEKNIEKLKTCMRNSGSLYQKTLKNLKSVRNSGSLYQKYGIKLIFNNFFAPLQAVFY